MACEIHFTTKFFLSYYLFKLIGIIVLILSGLNQSTMGEKIIFYTGILNTISTLIQFLDIMSEFRLVLEGINFEVLFWFTYIKYMVNLVEGIIDLSKDKFILKFIYSYQMSSDANLQNNSKSGLYLISFIILGLISSFFTFLYLFCRILVIICDIFIIVLNCYFDQKLITVKEKFDLISNGQELKNNSDNSPNKLMINEQGKEDKNEYNHLDNTPNSYLYKNNFNQNQSSSYVPINIQSDRTTLIGQNNCPPEQTFNIPPSKFQDNQSLFIMKNNDNSDKISNVSQSNNQNNNIVKNDVPDAQIKDDKFEIQLIDKGESAVLDQNDDELKQSYNKNQDDKEQDKDLKIIENTNNKYQINQLILNTDKLSHIKNSIRNKVEPVQTEKLILNTEKPDRNTAHNDFKFKLNNSLHNGDNPDHMNSLIFNYHNADLMNSFIYKDYNTDRMFELIIQNHNPEISSNSYLISENKDQTTNFVNHNLDKKSNFYKNDDKSDPVKNIIHNRGKRFQRSNSLEIKDKQLQIDNLTQNNDKHDLKRKFKDIKDNKSENPYRKINRFIDNEDHEGNVKVIDDKSHISEKSNQNLSNNLDVINIVKTEEKTKMNIEKEVNIDDKYF